MGGAAGGGGEYIEGTANSDFVIKGNGGSDNPHLGGRDYDIKAYGDGYYKK